MKIEKVLNGRRVFTDFTLDFEEDYKKIIEENQNLQKVPYSAGFYVNSAQEVLLVVDKQPNNVLFHKAPGGCDNHALTMSDYLNQLLYLLSYYKFSDVQKEKILEKEKKEKRDLGQRNLILEFLEETGFYPSKIGFCCSGLRYNTETKKNDLLQLYYEVCSIEEGELTGLTRAIDEDVSGCTFLNFTESLKQKSPDTFKVAFTEFLEKKAAYLSDKNPKLSKEIALVIAFAN